MFETTANHFDRDLLLTETVSELCFYEHNVRYFDNDGFELTGLEQNYYERHHVVIDDMLNHPCDQQIWMIGGNDKFKLDHCLLLQRWKFDGAARQQIEQHRAKLPQLLKFLKIIPKWGLDFALDYYDGDTAIEVIHIENDYRSYEEAADAKVALELRILSTDWEDFTDSIIRQKDQWIGLSGFAQNDWKAVYWGLNKAEVTQKAYTGH